MTGTAGVKFPDGFQLQLGTGNDGQIFHNDANMFVSNNKGDLYIKNTADNAEIIFQSDDGSGGVATYFFLDPASDATQFTKTVYLQDNVKALFGNSSDLRIFHDGSDSFINDTGVGDLKISGSSIVMLKPGLGEFLARFIPDGAVELYYDGSKKLETSSIGVSVTGSAFFVRGGTNGTIASPFFENIIESGLITTNASSIQFGNSFSQDQGTFLRFRVNSNAAASTPINALTLASSGNATFAASVTTGGTININNPAADKKISFDRSTGDAISLEHDASGMYFYNETSANTMFRMYNAGSVQVPGCITVSGGCITLAGTGRIQGVDTVTASTDAANKAYVDSINTGVLSVSDDGGSTINVSGSTTARVVAAVTGTVSSSSANLATGAQIQTAIDTATTGALKFVSEWDASGLNGGSPDLRLAATHIPGNYYIVSVAGGSTPNGSGTSPSEWAVGDWYKS